MWSIAGVDTAGGAGLSADQRAADALGVHLCPVVACLTAQTSQGVQAVQSTGAQWLQAQLAALATDLPPRVIKTGLLGSVDAVVVVARWVDQLRQAHPDHPVALVVDPVLSASAGGAAFSTDAVVHAYRELLLPRATLLTPNRAEARRLVGEDGHHDGPITDLPALARRLKAAGASNVVITGGDAPADAGHCLDWLDAVEAQGWLTAPRLPTPHHHGSGCTFAAGAAAALALGHGVADAVVLARLLTHHALMNSHPAGQGPGPVRAQAGFASGPLQGGAPLPWLSLGAELPWRMTHGVFKPWTAPANGLYGIVDNGQAVGDAMDAGLGCVQLRHKASSGLDEHLEAALKASARTGATLFINDHWRHALACPHPIGLHLGQEDLLALSVAERHLLLQARDRLHLGLSSHSLWELARAAGCGASVIACGPVKPTRTKEMPWRPQSADNLRWWVAHSPVPVVAIGGLLHPADVEAFAACGPAALCIVRGLHADGAHRDAMVDRVRAFEDAVAQGRQAMRALPTDLPHPVL